MGIGVKRDSDPQVYDEKLDIHIDGVTYCVPRRRFKSGKVGFLLSAGASVHGRMSWIQVIVRDAPERTFEDRIRRKIVNRARKRIAKGIR